MRQYFLHALTVASPYSKAKGFIAGALCSMTKNLVCLGSHMLGLELRCQAVKAPLYLDRRVPGSADDDLVVHVDAPDVVGVAHELPNQLARPAVVNLDRLVQLETFWIVFFENRVFLAGCPNWPE